MKYTLRINALNIKLRIVQILIKVEVVRAVLTENLLCALTAVGLYFWI